MNDIIAHKVSIIHHSLTRIREVYYLAKDRLDADLTSQESMIFNLERTCQASVEITNHLNKTLFSTVPKSSRESFEALHKSGLISAQLALSLQELIRFSSSAVHDSQMLNLEIVKHVVENRLSDQV